jgi:hypothetical protein
MDHSAHSPDQKKDEKEEFFWCRGAGTKATSRARTLLRFLAIALVSNEHLSGAVLEIL